MYEILCERTERQLEEVYQSRKPYLSKKSECEELHDVWMKRSGQISISEYMQARDNTPIRRCGQCVCRSCLYWWSSRCLYGDCYDDYRAKVEPYDKAHPDKPPRTAWSNWDKPGEQAHWCRGGIFYPVHYCPGFTKYKGCQVKECLKCNVAVYQDGYIACSLVDTLGCEACYQEFCESMED